VLAHLTFEELPFVLLIGGVAFAAGALGYGLRWLQKD
jgi:hypothetical protein